MIIPPFEAVENSGRSRDGFLPPVYIEWSVGRFKNRNAWAPRAGRIMAPQIYVHVETQNVIKMRSSQIRVDPKFNETEKKTQSSLGEKAR